MARKKKNAEQIEYLRSVHEKLRASIQNASEGIPNDSTRLAFSSHCTLARKYYSGEQNENSAMTDGVDDGFENYRVIINRILVNIETKLANIAFNDPTFNLRPANAASVNSARVMKAGLQHYWRKADIQQELKKALLDSKILRYGVVHVGWLQETFTETRLDDPIPVEGDSDVANAALIAEKISESGEDGLGAGEEVLEPYTREIPESEIIYNGPKVRRIRPENVFFDPDSNWDVEDSRFIAFREFIPLDELKTYYGQYDQSVVKSIKGKPMARKSGSLGDEPDYASSYSDSMLYAEIYHFYDKRRRRYVVTCLDGSEFIESPLYVGSWPWKWSGYPLVVIVDHPIPDLDPSKCQSDLELAQVPQDALNDVRSKQLSHIAQFNIKYFFQSGGLDDAGRRALRSTVPGEGVEFLGERPPEVAQPPSIPADVYRVAQEMSEDMDYLLGVSDYNRANIPGGRRTATEVAAIQSSGSGRVDSSVAEFARMVKEVARRIMVMLQAYTSGVISIPVDNTANMKEFVDFSRETIVGEFDIDVVIGSGNPLNEEADRQALVNLLSTLMPLAQAGQVDIMPIVKGIIDRSGIPGLEGIIVQPQQPEAAPVDEGGQVADPMAELAAMIEMGDQPV